MTASEKKMLKVLAVILFVMAIVWGRRYMSKKSKSTVRGKRGHAASTARRSTSTARGGARKTSKKKKKQVLTPRDIPRLNDNLRLKLKQMKNPDVKKNSLDHILYDTTNIWLPIDTNDREVEILRRAEKSAAQGGELQADTMFFRGVAHVNGIRLAIIERGDRTIPWYVKQGEVLEDTEFVLTNISDNDLQITLLDKKARRERDKYRTIPWSGAKGEGDATLGNNPGNVKKPTGEVEAPDDFEPTEDDLEIME